MTISTTNTKDVYVGNGVTTSFPITFDFTDPSQIKFYLDDVESLAFTFDDAQNPTEVIADSAPANLVDVEIRRETSRIQSTNLLNNQRYEDAAEAIEDEFDRIVQMVQEIEVPVAPTVSNTSEVVFPVWEVATEYQKGLIVKDDDSNRYYRVTVDNYESDPVEINADIQVGKLEIFPSNNKGDTGAQGPQGIQGPAGADGADGLNGAKGDDGIFSEIASQAEAESGSNNTKGMTPLRVHDYFSEAIKPIQTDYNDKIDFESERINELNTEVELLKASTALAIGRYSGSQKLQDSATIELDGDNGVPLKFNAAGTEFVTANIYVKRGDDRFSSFEFIAQYIGATWYITRGDTYILDESIEVDGVTLSVTTLDQEGIISATTDAGIGTFEQQKNYMAWIAQEIPKGVLP